MNELPKIKSFEEGDIVRYKKPNAIVTKVFGQRIFVASVKANSLREDIESAGYSNLANKTALMPPSKGAGMILKSCFEALHGAGTWYYKILLGEQLYWIAIEHLEKLEKEKFFD